MPQQSNSNIGAGYGAVEIAASGTVTVPNGVRCLYIGGTGDLVCTMVEGGEVTFAGVPAGMLLPIKCREIDMDTSSCTDVVALY